MNFNEAIKKVENSDEFKKFKEKSPKAYLCAAFFIMDYDSKEEKRQIDYYVSTDHVMTFFVDEKEGRIIPANAELPKKEKIAEVNKEDVKIDEHAAIETAKKESEIAGHDFSKVIAVLQTLEGKAVWNLSCIKGLQMMRYHIHALDGKVLKKEKINLMDMMKIEPGKTPDYIQ